MICETDQLIVVTPGACRRLKSRRNRDGHRFLLASVAEDVAQTWCFDKSLFPMASSVAGRFNAIVLGTSWLSRYAP
jgi:hypothetical protein